MNRIARTLTAAILTVLGLWSISACQAGSTTTTTASSTTTGATATSTAPAQQPLGVSPDKLAGQEVLVLEVQGVIGPMVADYLVSNIASARRGSTQCIVIQLDTPGGLLDSTHKITMAILASDVPVVTYVWPEGARAASAGTFITLASHVAAMAPATHIGAAHPVDVQGGQISDKIVNDAAADIRSLAQRHGRNVEWAEKAVRESVSITASQALDGNVIELIANNLTDLVRKLDGRQVKVLGQERTLQTSGAAMRFVKMSWIQNFFQTLGHPNIAYILLMLGIWGLYFELANPGMVLPGVIGGLCLILGLLALSVLPIRMSGVLLILLSVILFVAELLTPTSGVLTIGGIIAFVLGSFLLFPPGPYGRVPWPMIITCSATTAAFMGLVMHLVVKAQRSGVVAGVERLLGVLGQAQSELDPDGVVLVQGEQWSARSVSGRIAAGDMVSIDKVEGLKLKVSKIDKSSRE